MKTTKIILTGDYEDAQIRALIPSFILTKEAQFPDSKIKNRNDLEIMNFSIIKTDEETKEVEVKWKPKK
jgi:hypothetical protein